MADKTYITDESQAPASQIGDTLETLASTIHESRHADESSYTYHLIHGPLDKLLQKVGEEALESCLGAKDCEAIRILSDVCGCSTPEAEGAKGLSRDLLDHEYDKQVDHLRYEAADLVYHLLVLLERFEVPLDEFAAELNARMTDDVMAQRPGAIRLKEEFINRGTQPATHN